MAEEFKVLIGALLDSGDYDNVKQQLGDLCNSKKNTANIKIKLTGDYNRLQSVNQDITNIRNNANTPITLTLDGVRNIHTELDEIETQLRRMQQINLNLGGTPRTRNAAVNEINRQFAIASSLQSRMMKQTKALSKLDFTRDTAQFENYITSLENMRDEYDSIMENFEHQFTDRQLFRLNNMRTKTQDEISQFQAAFQDAVSNDLADGKYSSLLRSLETDFNKVQNPTNELRQNLNGLSDAFNQVQQAADSGDFHSLFNSINNFNHAYKQTKNEIQAVIQHEQLLNKQYKAQQKAQDDALKAQQKAQDDALKAQQKATKLQNDKGLLNSDIDLWSKNNFEAATKFKQEIDNIRTAINNCNNEADLSNIKQQFQQLQKNVANQDIVDSIKKSSQLGEFDLEFEDLNNSLNQIREVNNELEKASSNLKSSKSALDTALGNPNDIQGILNAYNNYQKATEEFNAEYNKVKHKQDDEDAKENLQRRKERLDYEAESWLKEHSAATKKYGQDIANLRAKIASCNDIQLNDLENELKDIQFAAERAGVATKSIGDKLKDEIKGEFTQLFSVSRLFDYGVDAIRDMYNQVVEVDSAMVNLKKVTDETDSTYNKFLDTAADTAISLGRSMSSYVSQTADWTKLGYTLKEAQELSKLSSVYANVAEIDDATAVSDMVTAMKAYNIQAKDAVQITDALNELGNTFATDAGSLGQGLTKAAASMSNAGADLNQTLAMITGGAEITQNATEFGNFLKTSSMRIRGMKGELEELGEEVDSSVDSISKVQTQILNLTKNTSKPVNIFDDTGNFRNYYTIMEEIASIYDEMTSTDRASLDEILFGKVRANQGAALIKAFQSGQIQKAYATAIGSEGSAAEEQAKWMESLEAKMASFEAAWQHLSTSIMQSDFLGGFIDFGTGAVEFFADLVDSVGTLNTALLGAGITSFFMNLG